MTVERFEGCKWYEVIKWDNEREYNLKGYKFQSLDTGDHTYMSDICIYAYDCKEIPDPFEVDGTIADATDFNSTRKDGTPSRYAGRGIHNIETIDAMEYVCSKFDSKQAASISQIVKYLSRYNYKGGYRDLDSASDYLKRVIGEWK